LHAVFSFALFLDDCSLLTALCVGIEETSLMTLWTFDPKTIAGQHFSGGRVEKFHSLVSDSEAAALISAIARGVNAR
jgi:hypothetical protein